MEYSSLPLNSPPRATFPAPLIYICRAFNYYLVGEATISGDYNQNGVVDAADYVTWRNGLGTIYNQNDYGVWRSHFRSSLGPGSGSALPSAEPLSAAVPEPSIIAVPSTLSLVLSFRSPRRSVCK